MPGTKIEMATLKNPLYDTLMNDVSFMLPGGRQGGGLEEGLVKGREEGREEGRIEALEEAKVEMALKMLGEGFDANTVSRISGLTVDAVLRLKSSAR